MKRFFAISLWACLLLVPLAINVHAQQKTLDSPPMEQPLVREGSFAVRLANALNLSTAEDEEQAESTLTSVGITPRNGWISDYPMTPASIGEIKSSAARAAEAGKLAMNRDEAVKVVQQVSTDVDLPVATEGEKHVESPVAPRCGQYLGSTTATSDDDGNSPPVVTYYGPPCKYANLYSWVPYPFWWGSFGFTGFFVLNDFNRTVMVASAGSVATKEVNNHKVDKRNKKLRLIDPLTRSTREVTTPRRSAGTTELERTAIRGGVESIQKRNLESQSLSVGRSQITRGEAPHRADRNVDQALTEPKDSPVLSHKEHGKVGVSPGAKANHGAGASHQAKRGGSLGGDRAGGRIK